jgi:outer membrane protein
MMRAAMSAVGVLRLTGLVCAAFLALAAPRAATAETLAETLVSAYENSGLLEQNRALLRAADEDVAQVVSELRPIINWSSEMAHQFGQSRTNGLSRDLSATDTTLSLTMDLLLYDFGRTRYRLKAAREAVLATRESLRSIEQQVLFGAVSAFMNVRRARELLSVRENNLKLLKEELRAARDRFEVGEVTRTDVALAEAQLASARSGLASARGDLTRAEEEFRNLPETCAPRRACPTCLATSRPRRASPCATIPTLNRRSARWPPRTSGPLPPRRR